MNKTSGTKHDSGKPRMELIPPEAELEEAMVWTFGAVKYEDYNWTKGFKFSRILGAAQRHLTAIKSGELVDPESDCLHAAHVRCCMGMLIYYIEHGVGENDLHIPNKTVDKA